MKKIFLIVGLMLVFFVTSVLSQATEPIKVKTRTKTTTTEVKTDVKKVATTTTKVKTGKKPIKGRIASLTGLFMGGDGNVSKEQAVSLAEKGDPIVFVVGQGKKAKIYFVYNTDGSFGGKNLAKYANNKFVGIIGKTSTKNGINFFIAEMIESMD